MPETDFQAGFLVLKSTSTGFIFKRDSSRAIIEQCLLVPLRSSKTFFRLFQDCSKTVLRLFLRLFTVLDAISGIHASSGLAVKLAIMNSAAISRLSYRLERWLVQTANSKFESLKNLK